MKITRNQLRQIIKETVSSSAATQTVSDVIGQISGNDYLIDEIVNDAQNSWGSDEENIIMKFDHWTKRAESQIRKAAEPSDRLRISALSYLVDKIYEKGDLNLPGLKNRVNNAKNIREMADIIRGLFFNSQMGLTGPLNAYEAGRLKRLIIQNMSASI